MSNIITKTKLRVNSLGRYAAVILFFIGVSATAKAQSANPTPYCGVNANNFNTTCDVGNSWVAAFEKVEFNKLKFAGPSCPNINRGFYSYWQANSFPNLTTSVAPGATYNLHIENGGSYNTGTQRLAGWIDWNGDRDFNDAGEYVVTNRNVPSGSTSVNDVSVAVPCGAKVGVTRLRLRTAEDVFTSNESCNVPGLSWGEAFDFDITIDAPVNPTANFFIPDTIFTNSPANFLNGNQKGYIGHEWFTTIKGLTVTEATTNNLTFSFPVAGNYQVRLTSENCKGKATVTKNVVVVDPKTAPTVRFLASRNYVPLPANLQPGAISEFIDFLDFSTSGPTSYFWDLTPSNNNAFFTPAVGTLNDKNFTGLFLNDSSHYEVCLTASNSVGATKVCKQDYVILEYPLNPRKYENIICTDAKSSLDSGVIYDPGGKDNFYPNNNIPCSFVIDVCDAKEIIMTIPSLGFDVRTNDFLRIYDGPDITGKLLWQIGNNQNLAADRVVTATSGKATIEFTTNIFTNGAGFELFWKTVFLNDGPIKAGIKITDKLTNDSIYNCLAQREIRFENTTTGTSFIDYDEQSHVQWIFDYSPFIQYPPGFEDVPNNNDEKNPTHVFTNSKTYTVRLIVFSCEGWDTTFRTFHLETTSMIPQVDFAVDEGIINTGEWTTLRNKTIAWCSGEWTISPADFKLLNGGDVTDQDIQVQFDKPGRYTVKYTANNDNGQASRTRTDYIRVIDYCEPSVATTLQSMSIERVKFNGQENISGLAPSGYENFTSTLKPIEVFIGGSYDLEVDRTNAIDKADRRIWIDYNRDGEFDASEIVARDDGATVKTLKTLVTIPDNKVVTAGLTRMRVAIAFAGKPFPPCGPIDVGEYEDYSVLLKQDDLPPVITMLGADTIYVEINSTYTDPGATAMDNREGNITSKIETVNQVDLLQTGVYVVTYNVADGSGIRAATRMRYVFVVADLTKPVLTILGNTTVTHEVNTPYVDDKATAIDSPTGAILDGFIVTDNQVDETELGTYKVNYTVTDAYGNTTTGSRTVNVVDRTVPVINAVGGNPMRIQVGSTFIDPTTVTDNYWQNVKLEVVTGNVQTKFFGDYKVTYAATDGSGNKAANLTRVYEVTDLVPPVLSSRSGSEFMLVDVNDLNFVEPQVDGSDNYFKAVSIVRTGNFDITTLGDYNITYTGTDGAGNIGTYTRLIRVVDREKPEIVSLPANVFRWQVFDPLEGVSTIDNYYPPSSFDNSGDSGTGKLEIVHSNVNTLQVGLYQVIYQAVDGSGNVSLRHLRLVSVVDNTTGLKDIDFGKSIKVYPNPTNGMFEVEFGSVLDGNSTIAIKDITGKTLLNFKGTDIVSNKLSVDLSNVAAGVYMVQVQSNGNVANKKVTITR